MSEQVPARYFLHPEGGLQAVHNLRDPAPLLEAGYAEVDEDTYRATLTAPHDAGPDFPVTMPQEA